MPLSRSIVNFEKKTNTTMQISASKWLDIWQANRRLTRRVIEAFPEDQLFSFSIGGMRTFGDMIKELLAVEGPGIEEIVTGVRQKFDEHASYQTKHELLDKWDAETARIDKFWADLPSEKYLERVNLFGQYESSVIDAILYFVENEIHHRGQGFVYLRSLGIQPPFFWER